MWRYPLWIEKYTAGSIPITWRLPGTPKKLGSAYRLLLSACHRIHFNCNRSWLLNNPRPIISPLVSLVFVPSQINLLELLRQASRDAVSPRYHVQWAIAPSLIGTTVHGRWRSEMTRILGRRQVWRSKWISLPTLFHHDSPHILHEFIGMGLMSKSIEATVAIMTTSISNVKHNLLHWRARKPPCDELNPPR
ncbi:hypothetical protein BDV32DRAFT_118855 [Aspergillus pseudonomiae]|nr:hypothetical protein BDV32DRAFT_118855 [Aspergillus pseudonomiae]